MTVEQPEPVSESASAVPAQAASESASAVPAQAASESASAVPAEQPVPPQASRPAEPPHAAPRQQVDVASVHPMDWGIMATGLLTLIFSFFDYYDYSLGPFSANYNAWDGFFGWFSTVVALLSALLLAVAIFLPGTTFPVPVRLTVLAGFTVSTVCVVFAGFIDSRNAPAMVDTSRGAGYWLSLLAILAGGVLAYLRVHEDGSALPWEHRKA